MKLDVGLLYQIGLPIALACVASQLAAWRWWRRESALLWWAGANGIGALGAILQLSRQLPWWLTAGVANTLIFGSGVMCWLGMRRFAAQPSHLPRLAAALLAYFAAFECIDWFAHDLAMRVVFVSLAQGLVSAGIAWELARAQASQPLRVRALLVALFAVHAMFYLFRSATAVIVEADQEFLRTGGIQNLSVLVGLAKLLLWNAGVLLMLRERGQ